jgi:hypothetical protein
MSRTILPEPALAAELLREFRQGVARRGISGGSPPRGGRFFHFECVDWWHILPTEV